MERVMLSDPKDEAFTQLLMQRCAKLLNIIANHRPAYWEMIKDSHVNMDITIEHLNNVMGEMVQEIESLQDEVKTLEKDVEIWQERVDDLCEIYDYLGDK
jgi:peptidoglycan hydrolase CwlO-like protein